MANAFTRGAWTLAVLAIGLVTILYAADHAYETSDQNHEVIETLHPVFETLVWVLPWTLIILIGVVMIGGAAYFKSKASPGRGGGR